MERTYIAIDLKSFYASVECVDRHLDPLDANLVVADITRTEKTICLAVSPSLKEYGISGRARLFEVVQRMREVNAERRRRAPGGVFSGKSYSKRELGEDPSLEAGYIVAPPRMARYEKVSVSIFDIYRSFVSPEDIHVYSIDEVFIDVTPYLGAYRMAGRELAAEMIRTVLARTGITATAGVGTNLYLAKVAMDIVAKHVPADENGVRIAELDEMKYRELLWAHRPITDFWRVGRGYRAKLEKNGMFTMGDVARRSLSDEDSLFKLFGINAELLIDHAWGIEPCTIADIKAYRPSTNSLSSGQVLQAPYSFEMAKLIVREMTEALVLELVEKGYKTRQMGLYVGYDVENLKGESGANYRGETVSDWYGRAVPKPATGSCNLSGYTSSTRAIVDAVLRLFERIADPHLFVRRLNVSANYLLPEDGIPAAAPEQLDLFTDYTAIEAEKRAETASTERERRLQETTVSVHRKFGKNALLKGADLVEGATARERNEQIGGHKK